MNEDALRELRATISRAERQLENAETEARTARETAEAFDREAVKYRAAVDGLKELLPS